MVAIPGVSAAATAVVVDGHALETADESVLQHGSLVPEDCTLVWVVE